MMKGASRRPDHSDRMFAYSPPAKRRAARAHVLRRLPTVFCFALCVSLCLSLSSCASSPETPSTPLPAGGADASGSAADGSAVSQGEGASGEGGSSGSQGGTVLSVPSSEQLRRERLNDGVLFSLEIGSPDSIRVAVDRITADPRGMSDLNRSALALAGELMDILYPLERVTWAIPSVPEQDVYARLVRSAKLGIPDYSGGDGFFALVLPALSLFYTPEASLPLEEMDAALSKAAELNSHSVLPPFFRAVIAERRGDKASSAELYRQAWNLDNGCYPAGFGYTAALIERGDAETALRTAKVLLQRYPASAEAMGLCAEASIASGDWQAAEPYILSALQLEPNNARFLLLRARVLVEQKEYLRANTLLDAFSTVNRSDKSYLLLKARIGREWNKSPASAVSFLQEAQRLYPDDIDVMLASAEICYESGMTINGKTGRDFTLRILEENPDHRQALALLVADYIAAFDWQNALTFAERFSRIAPGTESSLLLAKACSGAGQTGRTLSIARNLYTADPSNEEVADLYIEALVDSGDAPQARRVIDSLMPSAAPSLQSKLYYHLSRLQTDPEMELSSLRSSLLTDPRNSNALFAMYAWYYRTGEYRRAQYYLKQVAAINPLNTEYSRLLSELDALLNR